MEFEDLIQFADKNEHLSDPEVIDKSSDIEKDVELTEVRIRGLEGELATLKARLSDLISEHPSLEVIKFEGVLEETEIRQINDQIEVNKGIIGAYG